MDREHLGSLLFLSSLAAASGGCAGGTGGPAPRPSPYVTNGGDDGNGSSDTWTDPLGTTGNTEPVDSKGQDETGDWPNEGETGAVSDGTSGGPDLPPDDSGATGMGSTSDASGGSSGGDDESSTGYYPPIADPCPALAQAYADCDSDYTYASEIQLCNQARASAEAISPACGAAHAEYLACLSTLDCATLFQPGVPLPCVIQGAATDLACAP